MTWIVMALGGSIGIGLYGMLAYQSRQPFRPPTTDHLAYASRQEPRLTRSAVTRRVWSDPVVRDVDWPDLAAPRVAAPPCPSSPRLSAAEIAAVPFNLAQVKDPAALVQNARELACKLNLPDPAWMATVRRYFDLPPD